MIRKLFAAAVAVAAVGFASAAEIKSGPQSGEKVPGPFTPLNINGENAGKKACLFCKQGDSPSVAIFARTADCPGTAKLIQKIEATIAANEKSGLGSYVVFLSDDDKLEGELKKMVEKANIKNVMLSIDSPKGPEKYNISKDADLTVLVYNERKVVANHSFEKGKISDKDIETIAAEAVKMSGSK
ncbi:MAG: hypothetical protein ABGY75_07170 [Gemmataceae bacterium]